MSIGGLYAQCNYARHVVTFRKQLKPIHSCKCFFYLLTFPPGDIRLPMFFKHINASVGNGLVAQGWIGGIKHGRPSWN
jgi:hypothetical protein